MAGQNWKPQGPADDPAHDWPEAKVHVFWRADDRDPFTYAGLGKAIDVTKDVPVKVRWRFNQPKQQANASRSAERLPAEAFVPTMKKGQQGWPDGTARNKRFTLTCDDAM